MVKRPVIKLHPVFLNLTGTRPGSVAAHQLLRHKSTFGLDRSAPTHTAKSAGPLSIGARVTHTGTDLPCLFNTSSGQPER